jgi:protein-tyrosine phosphatase
VLFVCLGNICRSPTAQGVFEGLARARGLSHRLYVDSAGTAAWHIGKAPDRRSQEHAGRRGYSLSHLRARQVQVADFDDFDWVLAMDRDNLAELKAICPMRHQGKVRLLLSFSTLPTDEVPDPYYGGASGFEQVLDLVESASAGLLDHLFGAVPG